LLVVAARRGSACHREQLCGVHGAALDQLAVTPSNRRAFRRDELPLAALEQSDNVADSDHAFAVLKRGYPCRKVIVQKNEMRPFRRRRAPENRVTRFDGRSGFIPDGFSARRA